MGQRSIPGAGEVHKVRGAWQGTVSSVTYTPVSETPRYTAQLSGYAGTTLNLPESAAPIRAITLLWLGRRKVGGVQPGSVVRINGMLAIRGGIATMINPRFEVIAAPLGD